ncbi:unnamed protein product [Parajaminaea phylloscopi]
MASSSRSIVGPQGLLQAAGRRHLLPQRCLSHELSAASRRGLNTSQPGARRRPHAASARATTSERLVASSRAASLSSYASSSSSPLSPNEYVDADAVILGGGVVGLSLAAALVESTRLAGRGGDPQRPLQVVLLEASDISKLRGWASAKEEAQRGSHHVDGIHWENRVVSVTKENWDWLEDLGVTEYLVHERIKPVTFMHVTDGLSGAALDLGSSAGNAVAPELSRMVELSNLQQALLRFIESATGSTQEVGARVEIWDKTKVEDITPDAVAESSLAGEGFASSSSPSSSSPQHVESWPLVTVTSAAAAEAGASSRRLRPRLLVGADGPSSPVRKYAGIQKFGWKYDHKGLVATMRFDPRESQGRGDSVAYQRFLPSGTIAWLPLSTSAASLVWTLPVHLTQLLTDLHRSSPDTPIMADLVTAAWRLPWSSLSYLFALIETQTDPQVLRKEIASRLQVASMAGKAVNEQDCPPPVDVGVDALSVASFPLQVAHAESYLGSSLEAQAAQADGRASLFPDPSSLFRSAVRIATDAVGGKAQNDSVSPRPQGRTVLVGDAAHSVHPLAGQGLNLGLSDARSLAHTLEGASEVGGDWGNHESLKGYEEAQWTRNQMMLVATDRLHFIYTAPVPSHLDYRGSWQKKQGAPDGLDGPAAAGAAAGVSSLTSPLLDAFYSAKVWARTTGVEVLNELDLVKDVMQRMAGSGGDASARSRQRREARSKRQTKGDVVG